MVAVAAAAATVALYAECRSSDHNDMLDIEIAAAVLCVRMW
jgi:hypothetical protein